MHFVSPPQDLGHLDRVFDQSQTHHRLANRAPATAAIVRSIQALQQATKDGL